MKSEIFMQLLSVVIAGALLIGFLTKIFKIDLKSFLSKKVTEPTDYTYCQKCGEELHEVNFCPSCELASSEKIVTVAKTSRKIEQKYKTFWRRFWAGIADSIVFMPFYYIHKSILNHFGQFPIMLLATWFVIYYMSSHLYNILLHGYFGQTIGKKLFKVKVVDVSEKKLAMSQTIKRDIIPVILTLISLMYDLPLIFRGINPLDSSHAMTKPSIVLMQITLFWFLTEMTTMLFSKKRRAVHDFIARSVVIKYS